MRNVLAVGAGLVAGFTVPATTVHLVRPLVSAGDNVLAWELGQVLDLLRVPGSVAAVVLALAAAICFPGLMLAVSEVVPAGRDARRAAMLVLLAAGLAGLFAPGAVGAFVLTALVLAVIVAVIPGHWASVPLGVFLGVLAGSWWAQVLSGRWWLTAHADRLADLTQASPSTWVVVVAFLRGALLTGCAMRACRPPAAH